MDHMSHVTGTFIIARLSAVVLLHLPVATMQNEEGQMVDLYVPRKCSATNRIITAKDHASVQINVGHIDENGLYDGRFTTFALSGFIRAQGDADSALDRLWQEKKADIKQNATSDFTPGWLKDLFALRMKLSVHGSLPGLLHCSSIIAET
ncbi:hypothetical protein GUJ93_ZPchr0007g3589 [Zizania palustris]|uniref:Small ribosomal subunit protein eS21 n=1 Tax=Zizania palustris TaxID=103762 RepID=A0A8J5T4T4_ZIZPA|nr:hypothetical protein GUJ93_ZPchr0007g3589 [Zizania palustris]